MKIRTIGLTLCALLLAVAVLVSCSPAQPAGEAKPAPAPAPEAEFEWAMGSVFADPASVTQFNDMGHAMQMFVDLVNARSNGRIKIMPHYAGSIGGLRELFEATERGDIETAFINPMGGSDPRFDSWKLPYLLKSYDDVDRITASPDTPAFKLEAKWLAEHNVKLLAFCELGWRELVNNVRPVTCVADVKDMKIRVPESPITGIYWKEIALPTVVSLGEVYGALQTGIVDGMKTPATQVYAKKFYEVGKYLTFIHWQWNPQMILLGMDYWNSLPPDLQEMMQNTATQVALYERAQHRQDTYHIAKELEKLGMEVNYLSPEALDEFAAVAERLAPKFAEFLGEDVYKEVMAAVRE